MTSRLAVDSKNQLTEARETPQQPAGLRIAAQVISVIFHPVFVPVYVIWFMVFIHPYLFTGIPAKYKMITLLQSFVMFTFFPVATALLLRGLKFIDSIHLKTQRDRIIPLVACGIWYFWIWHVWRNLPDYFPNHPKEAIIFALGVFIASSCALLANIYMKVSLHAISIGVAVAFMLILAFNEDINLGIYISVAFFTAGLVCTARMLVSDHTQAEIYVGLIIGMAAMFAAKLFG